MIDLGPKSSIEIIYIAREALAVPMCWLRGDYADGDLGDDKCFRFSLGGAIMQAAGVDKVSLFVGVPDAFNDALLAVASVIGPKDIDLDARDALNQALNRIETWNDGPVTTHADVLDVLERSHQLLASVL